jgi:hypothetical protein
MRSRRRLRSLSRQTVSEIEGRARGPPSRAGIASCCPTCCPQIRLRGRRSTRRLLRNRNLGVKLTEHRSQCGVFSLIAMPFGRRTSLRSSRRSARERLASRRRASDLTLMPRAALANWQLSQASRLKGSSRSATGFVRAESSMRLRRSASWTNDVRGRSILERGRVANRCLPTGFVAHRGRRICRACRHRDSSTRRTYRRVAIPL